MRKAGAALSAAVWWVLLSLWSGTIFWVSHNPVPPGVGPDVPGSDKLLHAGVYALWGSLCLAAIAGSSPRMPRARRAALAALLTALYGAGDEIHQAFVPERTCDLYDWLADVIGGALAITFWTGTLRPGRLRAAE